MHTVPNWGKIWGARATSKTYYPSQTPLSETPRQRTKHAPEDDRGATPGGSSVKDIALFRGCEGRERRRADMEGSADWPGGKFPKPDFSQHSSNCNTLVPKTGAV